MIHGSNTIRPGCTDMWNAFMVEGAQFSLGSDIPLCPCTATDLPANLISYTLAKTEYKKRVREEPDFHVAAFVHFYIDDQKFDGKESSIWLYPQKALDVLRHFDGIISPDFSTFADFPDPIKRYNTYRMRAFGYWLTINGLKVINNVRWNTKESWEYCFDGIPYNSFVSIGTVASGITKLENRPIFEDGLKMMVSLLRPHTIIVYGSSNYDIFSRLKESGIQIVTYQSETSLAFSKRRSII